MTFRYAPPSSFEFDGLACGELAGFDLADLYPFDDYFVANADYAIFYPLLAQGGGGDIPLPGEPDFCQARTITVARQNRLLIVASDRRTRMVKCARC